MDLAQIKKEQDLKRLMLRSWDFERKHGLMTDELEARIEMSNFKLGEIVVFKGSGFRPEVWIGRLQKVHFKNPLLAPPIRKATREEKKLFFDCGKHEYTLESAFVYQSIEIT